jgi:23S rRNA (pseudouridine1915-N3)-methyltransferase
LEGGLEIVVLAVGRMKAGPERELFDRFFERARKAGSKHGLRGFSVEEIQEAQAPRAQDRIAAEETLLLGKLRDGDRVIALDAGGDLIDSDAFAKDLAKSAAGSTPRTALLIGGPDGLGKRLLDRSQRRISFGRMTWPHQLVRILLAEQLYRATTILSGHPYHRT